MEFVSREMKIIMARLKQNEGKWMLIPEILQPEIEKLRKKEDITKNEYEGIRLGSMAHVNTMLGNLRARDFVEMKILETPNPIPKYRVSNRTLAIDIGDGDIFNKGYVTDDLDIQIQGLKSFDLPMQVKYKVTDKGMLTVYHTFETRYVWMEPVPYNSRPGLRTSPSEILQKMAKRPDIWWPGFVLVDKDRQDWFMLKKMVVSGFLEVRKYEKGEGKPNNIEYRITSYGKKIARVCEEAERNVRWVDNLIVFVQRFPEYIRHEYSDNAEGIKLKIYYNRANKTECLTLSEGEFSSVSGFRRTKMEFRRATGNYNAGKDNKTTKEQNLIIERSMEMAQPYLNNPEFERFRNTPFGTINLEGGVESAWFTLDGKRVCIIPATQIAPSDNFVSKLMWLNKKGDHVDRLLARIYIKECTKCGFDFGRMFYDHADWKVCPQCAAKVSEMEDEVIRKAKEGGNLDE